VEWFSRADLSWGLYGEDIREISLQHDVDPVLVQALVRVESAFNPSAVSRKGAGGLMQLMPRTASALGVLDPFDPRENIRGGVRHLRYLLDRYRGNVAMAVAAYNAGRRLCRESPVTWECDQNRAVSAGSAKGTLGFPGPLQARPPQGGAVALMFPMRPSRSFFSE
jgi:Transglycosylase SLT domain